MMKPSKLSCCEWMGNVLETSGGKGYSVVAVRDADNRAFCLQARPFDPDVVEKYSTVDESTGRAKWPKLVSSSGSLVPYVLSIEIPLRYCPACGANLEKLIKNETKAFDALAEAMSHLV
jgi:hypothetical protein